MHLIYILPGGAVGTFLAVFIVLTWWFEDVQPQTRFKVLATLAVVAAVSVSTAVLLVAVDKLGWVDVPMPYDEPPPLELPATSEPPAPAAPPPKLESKTERTDIDDAREAHEQRLEQFGTQAPQ